MNNKKLQNKASAVNNSNITSVTDWIHSQVRKGDMDESTGRHRTTALQQMLSMVDENEPKDPQWMLENMPRLRERWARKNKDSKASTAQTYASRAGIVLREYLKWEEAPDKYVPLAGRRTSTSKPSKKNKAPKKDSPQCEAAVALNAVEPKVQATNEFHAFPRSKGHECFEYRFLKEGITFDDVKKFAIHLLTLADDFDVSSPEQAQLLSLVVVPKG